MLKRIGIGIGIVLASLALASSAQAKGRAGFYSRKGAASMVSQLPGVDKARSIGTTPHYYKVMEERGKSVKLDYVNRRTGAIERTNSHLQGRAKQLVALSEGRGGAKGGSTVRDFAFGVHAGDTTGRGLAALTNRGNLRIGLTNSKFNPPTTRNRIVNSRTGAISSDAADGKPTDR